MLNRGGEICIDVLRCSFCLFSMELAGRVPCGRPPKSLDLLKDFESKVEN